jgi:hypothetical protein
MLAEQDAAFQASAELPPGATDETGAPMSPIAPATPVTPVAHPFASQTSFDFGVEPVRPKAS